MWDKLKILDYHSKLEIKDAQEVALQKQIEYLYTSSPFYKKLFDVNDIDFKNINTLKDLTKIPTTDKKDLEQNNDSFLCVSKRKVVEYVTTSGTLGSPIAIALTKNDLDRLAYNEKRSLGITGISDLDTIQITTTLDKMFMAGMAYYMGAIALGATVIRSGIGKSAPLWETISKFRPTVTIAVPSFLYKFADYGLRNNINPNNSSIKKAICIGEPIRNKDFSPNKLHQKISSKWNIELFSTYASTEMMTAFTECEGKVGGHLLPELIVLELLDDKGIPVADGDLGEVTITPLGVEGMPVLRYRTGDLARSFSEKCKCGRNTTRLGPIEGRKNQMIKLKGTTLFPQSIEEVLQSFEEIDSYVIELSKSSLDTDHVKVYISNNIADKLLQDLQELFSSTIRVTPEIVRVKNDFLMKLLFPEGARKPKKIIDNRSMDKTKSVNAKD